MQALTPEMFAIVLPMAVKWVEDRQRFIFQHGQKLSSAEQDDAHLAGVQQYANDMVQLVTPQTAGLTLCHGIFIRLDCQGDRRLLVHEFVHTSQYERLGSIEAFLRQYLHECITFGYPQAPMEQEAIQTAQRICS